MTIQTINLWLFTAFFFFDSIVYMILRKSDFFLSDPRYKTSVLKEADKNRFYNKLMNYMEHHRPFLDPSLSLLDLAEQVAIPMRYLSQVINESFNQNYYDFINNFRIQESINYLKAENNGKKNILEIACAVGFNSKSTFNAAFKKHTGLTPREFKRNLKDSKNQVIANRKCIRSKKGGQRATHFCNWNEPFQT